MKLSEAMLRGARMTPHVRMMMTDGVGTCAVAATYVGLGMRVKEFGGLHAAVLMPWLLEMEAKLSHKLRARIITLNDAHGLSRERIAAMIVEEGMDVELPELRRDVPAPVEEPQRELELVGA